MEQTSDDVTVLYITKWLTILYQDAQSSPERITQYIHWGICQYKAPMLKTGIKTIQKLWHKLKMSSFNGITVYKQIEEFKDKSK